MCMMAPQQSTNHFCFWVNMTSLGTLNVRGSSSISISKPRKSLGLQPSTVTIFARCVVTLRALPGFTPQGPLALPLSTPLSYVIGYRTSGVDAFLYLALLCCGSMMTQHFHLRGSRHVQRQCLAKGHMNSPFFAL